MLERWITHFVVVLIVGLIIPANTTAQDMSDEEIVRELRELKMRISLLEEELNKKDHEIERLKAETMGSRNPSHAVEEERIDPSPLDTVQEHIQISGLIEFGGAWESVDHAFGAEKSQSDFNLTTSELTLESDVNDWVHITTTLLYEDTTFGEESGFDLDVATLTLGNTDKIPFYLTMGVFYVPFGALLTHFPDDPLVDQPLTLVIGETREKAVLLGYEYEGFSLSGYVFNGDLDETDGENRINGYGFDVQYDYTGNQGLELLLGASYISNIADSEGLTGEFQNTLGLNTIQDHVAGFDAYLHLGFAEAFFDAEYMTATDRFDPMEISLENGLGAQPSVWNLEVGYNWDWGKNLEIALKYSGSDESEGLGFPRDRYGLALNQTLFEGVTASLGLLHDKFEQNDRDGREDRNVMFGQIAVEF